MPAWHQPCMVMRVDPADSSFTLGSISEGPLQGSFNANSEGLRWPQDNDAVALSHTNIKLGALRDILLNEESTTAYLAKDTVALRKCVEARSAWKGSTKCTCKTGDCQRCSCARAGNFCTTKCHDGRGSNVRSPSRRRCL